MCMLYKGVGSGRRTCYICIAIDPTDIINIYINIISETYTKGSAIMVFRLTRGGGTVTHSFISLDGLIILHGDRSSIFTITDRYTTCRYSRTKLYRDSYVHVSSKASI